MWYISRAFAEDHDLRCSLWRPFIAASSPTSMRKLITHTAQTAWLRIAAAVLIGEQLAWFVLHPITALGSVFLGLVVLLVWQLLLGSRIAWVIAAFLAVGQLTAPLTLGGSVWSAALAALVLTCLLIPSSRAFVWAEKLQMSRDSNSPRSAVQRIYRRLLALVYRWVPRLVKSFHGKFTLLLVACVLVLRPLVGALEDFHHGSGHGSVLVDVLSGAVSLCYSLAELAAIVLVAMAAYHYLKKRYGGGKSVSAGPGSGQHRAGSPDTGSASRLDHVLDPRKYPDQGRPAGWYVDPSNPEKMRYWGGGSSGWVGNSRTPRKIRQAWR
jgi:hypothetical protein